MVHEPSRDGSSLECPAASNDPILSAYALDEVAGEERTRLDAHLAACPACREELALLGRAAGILRDGPAVEATLGAAGRERILEAARRSAGAAAPAVAPGRRPFFYWVAGLAAAALIAVGVMPWGSLGMPKPVERERPQIVKMKTSPENAQAPVEVAALVEQPVDGLARQPGADTAQGWSFPAPGQGLAAAEPGGTSGARETAVMLARNERPQPAEVEQFALAFDAAITIESNKVQALDEARKLDEGRRSKYGMVQEQERRLDGYRFYRDSRHRESAPAAELELTDSLEAKVSGELSGNVGEASAGRGERLVEAEQEVARKVLRVPARARLLSTAERQAAGGTGAEPVRNEAEGLEQAFKKNPKPAEEAAAVELAKEAQGFVHEFAPKLDPVRYSRSSSLPAADRDTALGTVPAAEPAQALPAPVTVATAAPSAPRGAVPAPASPAVPAAAPPAGATLAAAPAIPTDPAPDWKARVDDFLTKLDRKPGETPDMMFFRFWGDNSFVEAASDPQSTFGADADTASYALARSYLYKQRLLPPREAVRTEEFVNYFKSRYAPPAEESRAFAIHCEAAPSPFGHDPEYRLLKVGLKGREVPREKRKAASLVFVIDTSGSMRRENRLELVKEALRLLVPELDEGDSIGIVAFDAEARTVLEPVPASEKERILDAISRLEPRQNTNVAAGLQLGFQMAAARRLKDGTNRVILLSDGVANTGVIDPQAMLESVRAQRELGIYLTCVGVGMGNLNDTLLEQLADRGNGQCVYVDRIEEARKVFVVDLTATLEPIARDVKIQVEFDPARVIRYRLLGYENRAIADPLFRDNQVDAGEVGAGHEVAALYELKLQGPPPAAEKLATVRVRYLTIEHGEAIEIAREVTGADARASFADATPRFRLSACAAEFAEVLRESYHARGSELDKVAALVEGMLGTSDGDGRKLGDDQDAVELAALLKSADALVRDRERRLTEVARTTEALKENYYLRARIEDALQVRREENHTQIDDILRQNDALRRRLEDLLAAPR